VIAVQLIDSTGRVLGNLRLPSHLSLADLERLALAAGSPSLEDHIEQQLAAEVRARALEVGVLA
jgi:hypothetical protein